MGLNDADIWEEIVACRRSGRAAALCTIVSTLGSTPGKLPMKMLVRSDGTFVGSVGGGCLEAEVYEHARQVMATLVPMTTSFSLTEEDYPDSGLVCGGKLTVFIEPVTWPRVHVFGAGHVGAATARLAAEAGFGVELYDDRADMVAAAAVPDSVGRHAGAWEQTAAGAVGGDLDLVLVVTRGHHDDERVLRALAATRCQPRFLGMIGSRAKRRILVERLGADGVPADWLDAIETPVGVPIGARTAPEIAVSIVARLIELCRGPGRQRPADSRGEAGSRVGAAGNPSDPSDRDQPAADDEPDEAALAAGAATPDPVRRERMP